MAPPARSAGTPGVRTARPWRAVSAGAVVLMLFLPLELSRGSGIIAEDGPLRNLSATLGWVSFSLLVLALAAGMRITGLLRTFGLESLTALHVVLGGLAAAAAVAHLLLVVASRPADLALLNFPQAPPRAQAAALSTAALVAAVVLSLRRREMHRTYEQWRAVHGLLAVVGLVGALLHVILLNHLVRSSPIAIVTVVSAGACGVGLVVLWVVRPAVAARRPYRLVSRSVEGSLVRLTFAPTGRRVVPRYEAGQYFRICAVDGPAEYHPYTVASAAQAYPLVTFAIADNGDYSRRLRRLKLGALARLDGPYGAMTRRAGGAPTLMLVAGAGVTTALSLLRTAARARDRVQHVVVLSARTPEHLPFLDAFRALERRLRLRVLVTVTRPSSGWAGETGRVDADLLRRYGLVDGLADREVVICGPDEFVSAMNELVVDLGADPEKVFTERLELV